MSSFFLFVAAFLASAVEMVEALTIVLAIGVVRGWRSPLVGVAAAALVLAALVAALGPALRLLPLDALRLLVGALLLAFGLQWLRKAILRASGYRALRDEAAAFERGREQAAAAAEQERHGLDWYAFTLAFKGVLLEGLEVAFIVVSFGSGQGRLPLAATAAAAALIVVAGVGALLRAPLARLPEDRIKFAVGLLLTSFGSFWAVEGAGVRWPGDELPLLALLVFTAALALTLVRLLRRQRLAAQPLGSQAGATSARSPGSGGTSSSATTGASRPGFCSRSRHRPAWSDRPARLVAAAGRSRAPAQRVTATRDPRAGLTRSCTLARPAATNEREPKNRDHPRPGLLRRRHGTPSRPARDRVAACPGGPGFSSASASSPSSTQRS